MRQEEFFNLIGVLNLLDAIREYEETGTLEDWDEDGEKEDDEA